MTDLRERATKAVNSVMLSGYTSPLADALRKSVAEALREERLAVLEKAAKIAEEGPWFSPCFEDEKIAEQWEKSEQAFGNQIAVLIRELKKECEKR